MKKFVSCAQITVAVFALASSLASAVASAQAVPDSGEFDQIQTIVTPRLSIKSVDHVTFKGNRYKMDSVDPQSFEPYQDINDGQSYYHFVPDASTAARIIYKGKQPSALDELKEETQAKLQGMSKSGDAQVSGFLCSVFTKDLGDGANVTMYLSTDAQFPFIVKTTLKVPAKSLVQTNEIDNIKLGTSVDDDVFTLPKGTKIVIQPTAPTTTPDQSGQAPSTTTPDASAAPPAPAAPTAQ